MPELVAAGPDPALTWRMTIPDGTVTLGRVRAYCDWAAEWDGLISRLHATLTLQEGGVLVRKDPRAGNSIFFRGEPRDEFVARVGEHFVIGGTTFRVEEGGPDDGEGSPPAHAELTCSRAELAEVRFVDADDRIRALAELPGVIRYSPSDEDLERRVVDVLLRGVPRAQAAAVVTLDPASTAAEPAVRVRHAAQRHGPPRECQPSRRLVHTAVCRLRQSVLHSWVGGARRPDLPTATGADWAVCAPLPDEPAPGWALYLSGHYRPGPLPPGVKAEDLQKGDLKFAELVADVFGALRQVRDLQSRQRALDQLLSRPVLAALAGRSIDEVLRPRETDVTVLFCDLRGSCRIAEEAEDELAGACERVGEALTIMTTNIIDKDGVIGDFHGDAAMGFWGWPIACEDRVERAARAALAIRRDFERASRQRGHPLAGFACGIGIASGRAIAGNLGTFDQLKVSVFGPVVNLAARLEAMTKHFRVPVLLDEASAACLAHPKHSHWARCRRVARARPFGMSKALTVSELLPPAVEQGALSERDRRDYEAALDLFLAGQWGEARGLLGRVPEALGAALREFMARRGDAPPDWDGVIALESK